MCGPAKPRQETSSSQSLPTSPKPRGSCSDRRYLQQARWEKAIPSPAIPSPAGEAGLARETADVLLTSP